MVPSRCRAAIGAGPDWSYGFQHLSVLPMLPVSMIATVLSELVIVVHLA